LQRQNLHFGFRNFSPNILSFMRQCGRKRGRYRQATGDNIIPRMLRFACWMTKATVTHSECVIVVAFSRKQWLNELAALLRYTNIVCLVISYLPCCMNLLKPRG